MSHNHAEFSLSGTNMTVLRRVSEAYGIDGSWLAWRLEKHVLAKGVTPFRITTDDYQAKSAIKNGVEKITFVIDFAQENPNVLKSVRFHEEPSDKYFIVTQTSILHVQDSNTCALWFELPQSALPGDMGAVQGIAKVVICCDAWKEFLPASPHTELEQAQLIFAKDDISWVKKQAVLKDNALLRLKSDIAFKKIEMAALKNVNEKLLNDKMTLKLEVEKMQGALLYSKTEIDKLETALKVSKVEVEKCMASIEELRAQSAVQEALLGESEPTTPKTVTKKRKVAVPRSQRTPVTPKTVPRATQANCFEHLTTPTKKGRRNGGRTLRSSGDVVTP